MMFRLKSLSRWQKLEPTRKTDGEETKREKHIVKTGREREEGRHKQNRVCGCGCGCVWVGVPVCVYVFTILTEGCVGYKT